MRFKIDENLPVELVDVLRTANHDAMTVVQQRLGGEADRRIADVCKDEVRALLTLDLDFADIRAYPPEGYPGLIVLRLANQSKPKVLEVFGRVVSMLDTETLAGRLWIVDETTVRIRGGDAGA